MQHISDKLKKQWYSQKTARASQGGRVLKHSEISRKQVTCETEVSGCLAPSRGVSLGWGTAVSDAVPSLSSFSLRCCEWGAQGPGKDDLTTREGRGLGTVWSQGDMNQPQIVLPLWKDVIGLGNQGRCLKTSLKIELLLLSSGHFLKAPEVVPSKNFMCQWRQTQFSIFTQMGSVSLVAGKAKLGCWEQSSQEQQVFCQLLGIFQRRTVNKGRKSTKAGEGLGDISRGGSACWWAVWKLFPGHFVPRFPPYLHWLRTWYV